MRVCVCACACRVCVVYTDRQRGGGGLGGGGKGGGERERERARDRESAREDKTNAQARGVFETAQRVGQCMCEWSVGRVCACALCVCACARKSPVSPSCFDPTAASAFPPPAPCASAEDEMGAGPL